MLPFALVREGRAVGDVFEWQTSSPESQGMSGEHLGAMCRELERRGTKALLVIRNDRIIYEWYAAEHGPAVTHYTASLAKALVGGVSLTLVLQDGLLRVDDPAWKYVPQWQGHPEKSRITIRHLATHSSGIEDAAEAGLPHDQLPGWKGAFWRRDPNPFTIARDQAPVVFPPGSGYAYSNPGMGMLAYAVTAALRGTSHADIRTLLRERVMRPIGTPDGEWSIGYGTRYETDGLALVANWGGGSYTPRAVARVGRLMLRQGDWQGQQILSPQWVEKATTQAGTPLPERSADNPAPASGLGWWVNSDGVWPSLPRDAFAGAGAGNQILLVVPSLDLIVVRNGSQLGDTFWAGVDSHLFRPLAGAVLPPCPQSPVVEAMQWAPASAIVRKAYKKEHDGSDNWPVTWADDGKLYTAYGDGWGFDPPLPEKLSMGFARVTGMPPDLVGENVRSDGERKGPGRSGKKVSGMLMVEGVLYAWVRNANEDGAHSQLAWSDDRAETWTWSDWRFRELGYCTFLNFGRNYAGAPDDYVYVYSHDDPSAYCAADRMILARVPRNAIRGRDAYEFFAGLDKKGSPMWRTDISQRAAVFTHRHRCLRSSVSYNAGLGRYLWWQQIPNHPREPRTRFSGGFAVYDAPKPWGPWTAVYYTELWDVGPGETGAFPTKWMSGDGRTVYLVFSGDDDFSVRKGTLILGP